ncbi:MAG: hypothetical protein FK734_14885 [Asgard group archaeon]|nr:hypothetical protein [Asgard group archaeon]
MNKRMKHVIFSLLGMLVLTNILSVNLITGVITYDEIHYGYKSDSKKIVYWGGDQDEGSVYSAIDVNGSLGFTCYSESFSANKNVFIVRYDHNLDQSWNATWATDEEAIPIGIAFDSAKNVYVAGTILSELAPSVFIHNVFVLKYNASGSFRWATIHETDDLDETATSMVMDANANLIVTGYTNSSLGGMFVQKFNKYGVYQDTYYYGNTIPREEIIPGGVTLDDKANLFISATTNSTPTGHIKDLVLVKMNSTNGDIYWNTTFGGISADDQGFDVAYYEDAAYLTGSIGDVSNPLDGVVVKINATTGDIIWNSEINFDSDIASSISINRHGNLVVTGSVDFGASTNIFTLEINQTGYQLWNNTYTKSGVDISSDINCHGDFAYIIGTSYNATEASNNVIIIVYEDDYEYNFPTSGPYGRIFGIVFGILIVTICLGFIFAILFTYFKKR